MILTFKDDEDQVLNKVLTLLSSEPKVMTVQQDTSPVFTFPGLTIHPYQRQVFRGETEIPLTHLEFSVLLYLAQQPGRVFSQRQIFEAVWNMDSETCQVFRIPRSMDRYRPLSPKTAGASFWYTAHSWILPCPSSFTRSWRIMVFDSDPAFK